ncbi:hypothetical protein JTE90_029161 [Oedothorax gibbosus]|uniref:Chaoptin n=1 Tax=Oedothorax gibbosus TaxID=931172 RepID=A0AAV6VG02_9ARAC|nr:hypothetical protein JTE90_029161 [Oedothorax gibbosus]
MAHLQTLTLAFNKIENIDETDLKGLKSMQIFDISYNDIGQIENNVFEDQRKLRILSMAHNELENLSPDTFSTTVLEQLDLSFNHFEEFPEEALVKVKDSLQLLSLTGNHIKSINFSNIATLQNLRHFSISQNELLLPDSSEFQWSKLISLDLSDNPIAELPTWITNHLPRSLEMLNLANTSLKEFPTLQACNILHLNLSNNAIQTVESEALHQLEQIKTLDISNNLLSATYGNIWSNLQQLKSLYLQNNPIQKLLNNSFMNMERLEELYIKNLDLQEIHQDTFHQLSGLKKIEMDTYTDHNINLSQMLGKNQGIEEIHLHVQENTMDGKFGGYLPKSLKVLILEGEKLKHVEESAFSYIQSETLELNIKNSNITKLSEKVFNNLKVKNFTASFINNKLQKIKELYAMEKEVSCKHYSVYFYSASMS